MAGNTILWALAVLVETLFFALWAFALYQWRYSSLPSHSDPTSTWNWAARESQVLRQMRTFDDVGTYLNHLAVSPSDPQFDFFFITCDLLLFGYVAIRLLNDATTLAKRLSIAVLAAFLCSSWTVTPIPPQATGFPLLAYTRLVLWVDPLTAARTVAALDAWRHGGRLFGVVCALLLIFLSIATVAIGSAFGGSVFTAITLGFLSSRLFMEKQRFIFTNDVPTFPDAKPERAAPSLPSPSASVAASDAGAGLP